MLFSSFSFHLHTTIAFTCEVCRVVVQRLVRPVLLLFCGDLVEFPQTLQLFLHFHDAFLLRRVIIDALHLVRICLKIINKVPIPRRSGHPVRKIESVYSVYRPLPRASSPSGQPGIRKNGSKAIIANLLESSLS